MVNKPSIVKSSGQKTRADELLDYQLSENLKGNFENGWWASQELMKIAPDDKRALFNRGWHILGQGDLQGGLALLDEGRWLSVFGSKPINTTKGITWPDSDLNGQHILLKSEGGLGDEIINARFVKPLSERGARVTISASKQNLELMKSLKGISGIVHRGWEEGVYFDSWIPAMSAARITKNTFDDIPSPPYLFAKNPKKLEGDFKVGIRWSGNPDFDHEEYRRFPSEPLIDLYKTGAKLYSLQRDENLRDLPEEITDLKDNLTSMAETANYIAGMDLVITSCTSIAHLAGALGVPTWVIVPSLPYYTWSFNDDYSPWYKWNVRIFRQQDFYDWTSTLNKVRDCLYNMINTLK